MLPVTVSDLNCCGSMSCRTGDKDMSLDLESVSGDFKKFGTKDGEPELELFELKN